MTPRSGPRFESTVHCSRYTNCNITIFGPYISCSWNCIPSNFETISSSESRKNPGAKGLGDKLKYPASQKWNLGCNRLLEVYGFGSCHNWLKPVVAVLMGWDWLQPAVAKAYPIVKHLRAKSQNRWAHKYFNTPMYRKTIKFFIRRTFEGEDHFNRTLVEGRFHSAWLGRVSLAVSAGAYRAFIFFDGATDRYLSSHEHHSPAQPLQLAQLVIIERTRRYRLTTYTTGPEATCKDVRPATAWINSKQVEQLGSSDCKFLIHLFISLFAENSPTHPRTSGLLLRATALLSSSAGKFIPECLALPRFLPLTYPKQYILLALHWYRLGTPWMPSNSLSCTMLFPLMTNRCTYPTPACYIPQNGAMQLSTRAYPFMSPVCTCPPSSAVFRSSLAYQSIHMYIYAHISDSIVSLDLIVRYWGICTFFDHAVSFAVVFSHMPSNLIGYFITIL